MIVGIWQLARTERRAAFGRRVPQLPSNLIANALTATRRSQNHESVDLNRAAVADHSATKEVIHLDAHSVSARHSVNALA